MEREILFTGIGGQGVQLAAQVLARAATLEERFVLFFGVYEGMMRGGSTESTLVIADAPIESPPIVSRAWSAIALHSQFFASVDAKLRAESWVLRNSTLAEIDATSVPYRVFDVPATEIAAQLGTPQAVSMVMLGAYCGLTEAVQKDSLCRAMSDALPSYRRQHSASNTKAIEAGFDAVPHRASPFWEASRELRP